MHYCLYLVCRAPMNEATWIDRSGVIHIRYLQAIPHRPLFLGELDHKCLFQDSPQGQ